MLTNKLIARYNNPRRAGQAPEPGPVNVERDLRYSVFRVWRVAVVDGVLSSFGVPEIIAKKLEYYFRVLRCCYPRRNVG